MDSGAIEPSLSLIVPLAPDAQFTPSDHLDDLLPSTFVVSSKEVRPLVKPSDSQANLVLLGAFHCLRNQVRAQQDPLDTHFEPDERWAISLQRAVHRFQRWVQYVIGHNEAEVRDLTPDEYPPLDVAMVWHTYMLNPRTYYEDCLRTNRGLLPLGQPFTEQGNGGCTVYSGQGTVGESGAGECVKGNGKSSKTTTASPSAATNIVGTDASANTPSTASCVPKAEEGKRYDPGLVRLCLFGVIGLDKTEQGAAYRDCLATHAHNVTIIEYLGTAWMYNSCTL
ncbi:hypothetical protein FRB99_008772 [Tulasnella sp. 403]|nr:hypothetical protein FRB99_008772 [Tulasnella sp. 403]